MGAFIFIVKNSNDFSFPLTGESAMGFARDSLYNFARLLHRMAVHKPLLLVSQPVNRRDQYDTMV